MFKIADNERARELNAGFGWRKIAEKTRLNACRSVTEASAL
jgi:hypothetical protein